MDRLGPETYAELQRTYLLVANGDLDMNQFQYLVTSLKKTELQVCYQPLQSLSPEDCSVGYSVILTSLNFLSGLTNKVLEQAAWKYMNPNQSSAVAVKSDDQAAALTSVYEQVYYFRSDTNSSFFQKGCAIQLCARGKGGFAALHFHDKKLGRQSSKPRSKTPNNGQQAYIQLSSGLCQIPNR